MVVNVSQHLTDTVLN